MPRFRIEVSFTWDRHQWWYQWFRHRDSHGRSWMLDLWPFRFVVRTWERRLDA